MNAFHIPTVMSQQAALWLGLGVFTIGFLIMMLIEFHRQILEYEEQANHWSHSELVKQNQALLNKVAELEGKLKWARRKCDPVLMLQTKYLSSLQAKLHEHKQSYEGLRKMVAEISAERDQLKKRIPSTIDPNEITKLVNEWLQDYTGWSSSGMSLHALRIRLENLFRSKQE